ALQHCKHWEMTKTPPTSGRIRPGVYAGFPQRELIQSFVNLLNRRVSHERWDPNCCPHYPQRRIRGLPRGTRCFRREPCGKGADGTTKFLRVEGSHGGTVPRCLFSD